MRGHWVLRIHGQGHGCFHAVAALRVVIPRCCLALAIAEAAVQASLAIWHPRSNFATVHAAIPVLHLVCEDESCKRSSHVDVQQHTHVSGKAQLDEHRMKGTNKTTLRDLTGNVTSFQ